MPQVPQLESWLRFRGEDRRIGEIAIVFGACMMERLQKLSVVFLQYQMYSLPLQRFPKVLIARVESVGKLGGQAASQLW
jgi:hypothetical protein